jgi:transcriptional regulator with XRE-family HTH domain
MDSIDKNKTRILKIIGCNIRRLRQGRNFSQQELSEMAQINVKYLSEIETGKKNCTVLVLLKLSHALSVPSCEILTLTENRCPFRKKNDYKHIAKP